MKVGENFIQRNCFRSERGQKSAWKISLILVPHVKLDVIQSLKACSQYPFLQIRFLLVPKNRSCEHIKNDLPSNGSVTLKKRMETEHALSSSDTLLETWKAPTNFAWSFWRQIEDSLLVLKNGLCEHTTNDLHTFSPQKRNLEIGPSERLLPVFGTKNRLLKTDRVSGLLERPILRCFIEICNF